MRQGSAHDTNRHPHDWDERTTLTTFLDYTRATAVDKCTGLADGTPAA